MGLLLSVILAFSTPDKFPFQKTCVDGQLISASTMCHFQKHAGINKRALRRLPRPAICHEALFGCQSPLRSFVRQATRDTGIPHGLAAVRSACSYINPH